MHFFHKFKYNPMESQLLIRQQLRLCLGNSESRAPLNYWVDMIHIRRRIYSHLSYDSLNWNIALISPGGNRENHGCLGAKSVPLFLCTYVFICMYIWCGLGIIRYYQPVPSSPGRSINNVWKTVSKCRPIEVLSPRDICTYVW